MDENETKQDEMVLVYRVDRRGSERKELSCEEIMSLARKRGAKSRELWEGPFCGRRRRRG